MTMILVLRLLLLCTWFTHSYEDVCTREDICLLREHGDESECQQNYTTIRSPVSNVKLTCRETHIYITSGTHVLNGLVFFTDSVEETHINGVSKGSVITCLNEGGIRFSENRNGSTVFLSSFSLTHCGREFTAGWKTYRQAALHFKYASYSLQSVTFQNTTGYAVYAQESQFQDIIKCTFMNSSKGHVFITSRETDAYNYTTTNIIKNKWIGSKNDYAVSIIAIGNSSVSIQSNTFSHNQNGGLHVAGAQYLEIKDIIATKNGGNGIDIGMHPRGNINTPVVVNISSCLVEDNLGIGINLTRDSHDEKMPFLSDIFNVTFINNSRALFLLFGSWSEDNKNRVTKIRECSFYKHKLSPALNEKAVVVMRNDLFVLKSNSLVMENCSFRDNIGFPGNYSVLHMHKMHNAVLSNLDISNNDCTGIILIASGMKIENRLALTRNSGWQGGAIAMYRDSDAGIPVSSWIILRESSVLTMINNTAETYGGAIFTDESCTNRNKYTCFFQLETTYATPPSESVLRLSGNNARLGGDLILGGCLFNCSIQLNDTWYTVNKTDPINILWDIVKIENVFSQSTFAEYPSRARFCQNASTLHNTGVTSLTCSTSLSVSAFRGQTFTVHMIAADDCCFPTSRVVRVKGQENMSQLVGGEIVQTGRYCQNFTYALAGALDENTSTIEVYFQDLLATSYLPSLLTVTLEDCPPGLRYDLSDKQCKCHSGFKTHRVVCHSDTYTLEVPAQTWVGKYQERMIVKSECQYCKNQASVLPLRNITDEVCTGNRSGIMCGHCGDGLSLKLGGYACGKCSKSPLIGTVLVIAFTIAGLFLVFVLLRLDLTISTGMLNGLIFYSNIVYLNNDIFLPVRSEGSDTHMQNIVYTLSTFLAWMNLDFGIGVCFFHGYNTYVSTWMQFAYPLYIWLLIITIVLASWYSTIIAKVTTSNTVPVLATLLLLSYSKLLKTTIEIFSSVQLSFLDGDFFRAVWKHDGSIPFLGHLHLPLFLMGLLTLTAYIIPLTLLILLGPFLRKKSHHLIFRWIHKIKPFLDSFYGPYTIKYRYWPGLMLLTRTVIIGIFSSYSTNDTAFKLTTISMMVLMLFILWLIMGKTHTVSFYRKQQLNYLELFFLSNLGTIAVISLYITQFADPERKLRHQQTLAVVMVGSVFVTFSGIIAHQVAKLVVKLSAIRRIKDSVQMKLQRILAIRKTPQGITLLRERAADSTAAAVKPTVSVVDFPSNKMREPLLDSD